MLQQCNNPYRREVQQRQTRQDDGLLLLVAQSSWSLCRGKYQTAHSACSGETGCQSRCYLERKEKKHTKTKPHPFCLSLKVGMRSASLMFFSLSSVQHHSQTSPHPRGRLLRSQDTDKSYACPAQVCHVLSLSKAHTV